MHAHAAAARRITRTLFIAHSLASAGMIAAATISSIAGAQLSGQPALAGFPSGAFLLGTALAALPSGYFLDRLGRRIGLALAFAIGVVGSAVAGGAVVVGLFPVFLLGLVMMGVAATAAQLSRFAAAEVHPPAERGRAVSSVVLGGTVGAVAGPLLVGPSGQLAVSGGVPELAGPFLIGFFTFAAASLLLVLRLHPDPRDLGREVAALQVEKGTVESKARPVSEIARQPGVVVAVSSMVFAQAVMVMLMTITALHMREHDHALTSISVAISAHTFGMYAFSIVSGRLADRWGRGVVILLGAATLVAACLTAPLSPQVLPLSMSLFLLGLGWNLCYVGGSALLSDQLSPSERAKTQGQNDLLIGLASASGGLGSGFVYATLGFGAMGIAGAIGSLFPLVLSAWWLTSRRRVAPAA